MFNNLINIAIIVLIAYLAVTFIRKLMTEFINQLTTVKNDEYHQRLNTIKSLFNHVIGIVFYAIAVLMILNQFGFNILPILTGASILGLAISFGAQSLVKDIISGIFIIIDNTYNVGDTITVGDFTGKVQLIRIRKTILKDKDGDLIHLPNSEIQKVVVHSRKK